MRLTPNVRLLFFLGRKGLPGSLFVVVTLFYHATVVRAELPADIAVILSAKAGAYEKATDGFRRFCEGRNMRIVKVYNMKGDFDAGRQILSEIESQLKPDLVYVVGMWALELIVQQRPDLPVVYAMVLNPPSIIGPDTTNITGASMNLPLDQSLRLFKQLSPKIHRIGTLFTQAQTGYLIQDAKQAAQALELELVAKEIHSSKDAIAALKSLQREGVDALWVLPDKTVLDRNVVQQMLLASFRNKIPILGLSERQANMGTLLAFSFASIEDIGVQAGELAYRVLTEASAGEIPFTTIRRANLFVNLRAAKKLGIVIPQSMTQGLESDAFSQGDWHVQVTAIN